MARTNWHRSHEMLTCAAAANPQHRDESPEPLVSIASPIERAVIAAIAAMLPDRRPTVGDVAKALAVSPRTLQRRLEADGQPFRQLRDQCLYRQALTELRGGRPVSEIGERLGYADPAHFARAFRRWAGRSPTEVRRHR